jgi:hypothetical protein
LHSCQVRYPCIDLYGFRLNLKHLDWVGRRVGLFKIQLSRAAVMAKTHDMSAGYDAVFSNAPRKGAAIATERKVSCRCAAHATLLLLAAR